MNNAELYRQSLAGFVARRLAVVQDGDDASGIVERSFLLSLKSQLEASHPDRKAWAKEAQELQEQVASLRKGRRRWEPRSTGRLMWPPLPDGDGIFWRRETPSVLADLRVYWRPTSSWPHLPDGCPLEAWTPVCESGSTQPLGWSRFMRADQIIECLEHSLMSAPSSRPFFTGIHEILLGHRLYGAGCLVTVDEHLGDCREVLGRRIEAARLLVTSSGIRLARAARYFPDAFRGWVEGLDPVHTPESDRAGLTRYLAEGWEVGDDGRLTRSAPATIWGPSTTLIDHKLHDAPRRLMLGASLQTRAVQLSDGVQPADAQHPKWPHGVFLRAAFAFHGGWTHEDGIVVSESAVRRLQTREPKRVRVRIPAVATDVTTLGVGQAVQRGTILARAMIDAYALGLRRHDLPVGGAPTQTPADGHVEVALPEGRSPVGGTLVDITRRVLHTSLWREAITFSIDCDAPLTVGDKLATPHGIKGVVSRILPDDQMPVAGGERAEIVLSPLGIVRRGALGQLREADPSATDRPPEWGDIRVLRQPQDAEPRCRVRGPRASAALDDRGQRYGEMEFWALMAHGAEHVASELLSAARSSSSWIEWERRNREGSYQTLAGRALNRYFAVADLKIENGQTRPGRAFKLKELQVTFSGVPQAREYLDSPGSYADLAGDDLLTIPLRMGHGNNRRSLSVDVRFGRGDKAPRVTVDQIVLLPPWLRPTRPNGGRHELTVEYGNLLRALFSNQPVERVAAIARRCVLLSLDESAGAGGFLRSEVLGRRLTRSARAVIAPRPDLRIDEIAMPEWVAERLFDGLPLDNRRFVLVNRNPTLHRRGLLALRPVVGPDNPPFVFGLPLGILKALGADFDGDQASVVALETAAALAEAERLLPGAEDLRTDPFRNGAPAFPLSGELASPAEECELAPVPGSQEEWCERHRRLLEERLAILKLGWAHSSVEEAWVQDLQQRLWAGLSEDEWVELAQAEIDKVTRAVRRKGQLGGILRRELYRLSSDSGNEFAQALQALQAITERLTQSALSVKTGGGAVSLGSTALFEHLTAPGTLAFLKELDATLDPRALEESLRDGADPAGLLAWVARPTPARAIALAKMVGAQGVAGDCRTAWFVR